MKTIGIFIVCAQMLIHMKPKGAYEKYIRLLVSIMLLVQLVEPIGHMLGILRKGELAGSIHNMERKMEWIREQSYEVNEEAEDIWEQLLGEIEWEKSE